MIVAALLERAHPGNRTAIIKVAIQQQTILRVVDHCRPALLQFRGEGNILLPGQFCRSASGWQFVEHARIDMHRPPCLTIASIVAGNAAMWSQCPWVTAMHSTSPSRIPRLAQLRMKIAPSGPVSNSMVRRTSPIFDTSLSPNPRFAQRSASPEMTDAPPRMTFANSETANNVLLTYVSLTSSVNTSTVRESRCERYHA